MRETRKLTAIFYATQLHLACRCHFPQDSSLWSEQASGWRLLYAERGALCINGQILRSGEALLCPPETALPLLPSERPADAIMVEFDCSPARQFFPVLKPLRCGAEERQLLSVLLAEAAALPQQPGFGCSQLIKTCLEQLLIYLCRSDGEIQPALCLRTPQELVTELQNYMRRHLQEKLTLSDLAARCSISVSQLKRIFKEQTGTSVIACLTALRISAAKALIREHTLNFSQIAEAVGYDNIYYFSTMFKKQTGMTPTEYARSVRT